MSAEANTETLGFQAEVRQLLDLMIHSLYSNKEIFLRELISNASDAADRLRFEALSEEALYEGETDLEIRVRFDKQARTISVSDNGIGMDRQEVVEHLGTIAKSGTQQFFQSLTGDQAKDAQLIGQFGVGFYSSFIVADRVTVTSRRAGRPAEEGVRWDSSGEGEYTVTTVEKPRRGTEVVLHLREGDDEFLDDFRLRGIITKYSDHISLPILMAKTSGEKEVERVNSATALWARSRNEVTEEEYHEFYKHVAHDFEEPLARVHSKVEGKLEYTSLLFIPKRAPFDLLDRGSRHGVRLYVRRVFIMDDAEHLMPSYLRFVRGVIDSDDLPLNISRELLQRNKQIDAIRAGSVKKVIGLLENMAKDDGEKYASFWYEFGRVLKEGIIEDAKNRDVLAGLLRSSSTHTDDEAQTVSLQQYHERMKEGQDKIYFLTADRFAAAAKSPHLEVFRERGVEVLLLTDEVDEWVINHLTEFEGKSLQSVARGELDLDGVTESVEAGEKEGEETDQETSGEHEQLLKRAQTALGERVQAVRMTHRLTTSPACLVADENALGGHMERILQAAGQEIPSSKPILELNPKHPIVRQVEAEAEESVFTDWMHILFDQALLSEGAQLDDPGAFVQRVNARLSELTTGDPA
ncbi:MAG: molecular chaperone HtpG [Gammaproteobacteria bacterium]|nr:MAG: molecular chaperone HtpG [Gammaproteobacteria bacterium]